MYKKFFKRFFDFWVALIGFVIISPLFLLVILLLAIANQGKPFFTQKRPGKNGVIFRVIKFKTMNDKKDSTGSLLPPSERITPVGKFIRKTSLDEIPQFINVLKGDMSFIGPRPLRVEYLPLYTAEQHRRHEVRPGITGWAQVKGRNSVPWEERFKLDVWYVNNQSFKLDCTIVYLTIKNLLDRSKINDIENIDQPFKGIKLNS